MGMGYAILGRFFSVARQCVTSGTLDCGGAGLFGTLTLGALLTGALGAAIVFFVALSAFLTGRSRALLARTFPLVAFVALLGTGVVALGQALLLAGSVYIAQAYFMGETTPALVAVVGITALGTALMVFLSAVRMFRKAETSVVGIPIRPVDAPAPLSRGWKHRAQIRHQAAGQYRAWIRPNFLRDFGAGEHAVHRKSSEGRDAVFVASADAVAVHR